MLGRFHFKSILRVSNIITQNRTPITAKSICALAPGANVCASAHDLATRTVSFNEFETLTKPVVLGKSLVAVFSVEPRNLPDAF